jgi:diguanylate cyclase (GGDEF)-like protein
VNHYGVVRISPELEKFVKMRDKFTNEVTNYFPHSYDGFVRDNHDVWIATDGGGINIFNHQTGVLNTLTHDPNNSKSLSSNSVISITEDEKGYIWAGTWAGGISRINPDTLESETVKIIPNAPANKTLASNNVFVVESDLNGGIWLIARAKGLQYFNYNDKTFTNFLHEKRGGDSEIRNEQISHLQLFDNKVWIAGESGLEMLDVLTKKFTFLFSTDSLGFTYVYVHSYDEIWVGTRTGLVKFNSITNEKRIYTVEDGLSDNEITYIQKDKKNRVWVATNQGVSILDETEQTFIQYHEEDGLAGDTMSTHGEFFNVEGYIYMPGKYGVTIVDPNNLPQNTFHPKTIITGIEINAGDKQSTMSTSELGQKNDNQAMRYAYDTNAFKFDFSVLSFIFPQRNKFKYRLKGLQTDYTETSYYERIARFSSLPAGDYEFEVYGSNNSGIWDEKGAHFSFKIMLPWWETWWAITLFAVLLLLSGYLIMRSRIALIVKSEKSLQQKVQEKTKQLATYAKELKRTSDSLVQLNAELEDRVEQRTSELQVEVNERKNAESKLSHMAFHDSLTGLPNREWIIEYIKSLIEKNHKDKSSPFGVLFLDGDRFKQINDTHGHMLGDQLLIASAKRLEHLLDEGKFAARLGGDEFTVVVESTSEADLALFAQQIVDVFKTPFVFGKATVYFSVSIGLVICDSTYLTVPNVLRDADIAMYRAKAAGKSTYQIFDSEIQKATLELAELESGLYSAVENNDFKLAYQPIIDLENGQLSGFEALVRWEHPEKGVISPYTFIPIAEEIGLIWDIGQWVLLEACRQTKIWHDMGLANLPTISVNISSNQLKNNTFLDMLDKIIEQTGLDSKFLKLELTESVLIENNHALSELFSALHERGIDLAIDDFGTGYSSLAYLNEIPVQFLKIDRRFISAIDHNSDSTINKNALEIVKATISLGKSLSKKVTAEGIETNTQLISLIRHGCDFIQGYFLSKPLSDKDATKLLESPRDVAKGGVNVSKETYSKAYEARLKLNQQND